MTDIDIFVKEALPSFNQTMLHVSSMISKMEAGRDHQTECFVQQIEKLSSRIDEAHKLNVMITEQNASLTRQLERLQAAYDRLFNLLETRELIINNSNN